MAQPSIGTYNYAAGVAGYGSTEGGLYTYAAGTARSEFYAGEFMIDTGYDDPVAWTVGVQAAEIYGARVYARTGVIYPDPGASVYMGDWRIEATPVWSIAFYTNPGTPDQSLRVYIRCRVWLTNPHSVAEGSWQRLDTIDWTLYRV